MVQVRERVRGADHGRATVKGNVESLRNGLPDALGFRRLVNVVGSRRIIIIIIVVVVACGGWCFPVRAGHSGRLGRFAPRLVQGGEQVSFNLLPPNEGGEDVLQVRMIRIAAATVVREVVGPRKVLRFALGTKAGNAVGKVRDGVEPVLRVSGLPKDPTELG